MSPEGVTVNGIPVSGDVVDGYIHQDVRQEFGPDDAPVRVAQATPLPVRPGGTTINDGRKTVTTAGTRERLVASSTPAIQVIITAEEDNTGRVVVGGGNVVAALGSRRGIPLGPGDGITLDMPDLYNIYLDTTVDGDGVTFLYTA